MSGRARQDLGPRHAVGDRARRFIADASAVDMRLDAFVGLMCGISAGGARRLIDAGQVRLEGRIAAKGTRLAAGAIVEIALPEAPSSRVVVPDPTLEVTVLYADDALVAIDKPAGVPSHPLRAGERGTAANAIVARFPECAGASLDPREGGLGHRLDTDTSGVLIAARSREAWAGLRRALGADDCQKRYLCEVWGAPPDRGSVHAEIGRGGRRGGVVHVGGGGRRPQPAETNWTVIARGAQTVLLEARLHAGRAHQVRAHLASAGFPIVGDDRYGGGAAKRAGAAPAEVGDTKRAVRLRLHAVAVELGHPLTEAPLVIEAPPPAWARLDAFGPVR